MGNTGAAYGHQASPNALRSLPGQTSQKSDPNHIPPAYNPGSIEALDPVQRSPEEGLTSTARRDNWRCCEKGCVFPAAQRTKGVCLHHHHERREPGLFHSLQPTGLLMDAAKLGLPNTQRDRSRLQDRRRLAEIRERFLEEIA